MLFFDILKELLGKNQHESKEREAITELLIYAAMSDRRYDVSEANKLSEIAKELEWESEESFEEFYKKAISEVRDVLVQPERIKPFIEKRARALKSPESRKLALSACKRICTADRQIELEEDALVSQLEQLLK